MRKALKQTHFNITEDIISDARRHSCEKCAVALVLQEKFPKAAYVAVHTRSAEVLDPLTRGYYHFSFPDGLVDWIETFDEEGKAAVKPANFFVPFDYSPRTAEQFKSQYWRLGVSQ